MNLLFHGKEATGSILHITHVTVSHIQPKLEVFLDEDKLLCLCTQVFTRLGLSMLTKERHCTLACLPSLPLFTQLCLGETREFYSPINPSKLLQHGHSKQSGRLGFACYHQKLPKVMLHRFLHCLRSIHEAKDVTCCLGLANTRCPRTFLFFSPGEMLNISKNVVPHSKAACSHRYQVLVQSYIKLHYCLKQVCHTVPVKVGHEFVCITCYRGVADLQSTHTY